MPPNHLVRKMKAAIDFTFIYDLVKDMYSEVEAKVFIGNRNFLIPISFCLQTKEVRGNYSGPFLSFEYFSWRYSGLSIFIPQNGYKSN